MGQSKYSRLDGISFDQIQSKIYINHVDGTLVLQDQEIDLDSLSWLDLRTSTMCSSLKRVLVRNIRTFKMP